MRDKRIFKYPLPFEDRVNVSMPGGAKVLSVGEQDGGIVAWAIVDPDLPTTERRFAIAGTGHPLEERAYGVFIGTVQMQSGLVFHVFEI